MSELTLAEPANGRTRRTVVFVESAAAMAGVQFSTLYLVQHLDHSLWEPIVVCPQAGDLFEACLRLGIRTHVLRQPALCSTSIRIGQDSRVPNPAAWLWDGWAMLVAARRLARFLLQIDPDLVVTKGLFPHFYGGLAARKLGVPCVWHVQDFISERFLGFYRRAFRIAARWLPDHIIVDGAAIRRQLPRSGRRRVSVIHNGVDSNVFRPGLDGARVREELGLPAGAIVIGHVARMTPWKGQHYLLEAFKQIAREAPNAYLLFVGDPVFDNDSYQRQLLNLTVKLDLKDRVKFAGYRHDMPQVLAAMDLFAFTSVEKDTSPLALLSAMSCGLPIIAFDIEGVRELIDADDQVLLVPVAQADALAQSLLKLISDKELGRRMGDSARRQAVTNFSLDRYVTSIEEVFRRIEKEENSAVSDQHPSVINHRASKAQDCG